MSWWHVLQSVKVTFARGWAILHNWKEIILMDRTDKLTHENALEHKMDGGSNPFKKIMPRMNWSSWFSQQ